MKRYVLGAIVTVVAVGALAAIVMSKDTDDKTQGSTSSSSSQQNPAETGSGNPFTQNNDMSVSDVQTGAVAVDIKGFAFSQKTLKIKKGTKVTWTNQDEAKHDISPDSESEAFKASKLLAQGESYEFTFNTPGTYTYLCSPHPYMKASIEVVE